MERKLRISRLSTFGLAIASVTALAACASSAGGGGAASTVNVAVLLPLTGAHAPFGTALAQGAEAAAYVINQDGGVLGHKVTIVSDSTGGDPIDAVTLTRSVLAEDSPSMFIAFGGSDYPNALPIAEAAHVVVFADVGDPALDTQTNSYMYRALPSDSLTGTAMALWAHHQGYKRVALVMDAASGAQTLVPPIQAAANRLGLQIVASGSTDLAESAPSYETTVRTIIAAHPQALLLQLEPAGAGTFIHELDALGGQDIPVIGSDSTSTAEWVGAIGAAAAQRQLTSVVAATGSLTGAPGQQFIGAFQHLFHSAPRSLSDSNYDAMIIGALAMDAAHSTDSTQFGSHIDAVTTAGAGHVPVYTYAQGLQELKNGKQIDYVGLSSPWNFNRYHAITATYDAVKTAADGNVQVTATISANQLATLIK